MFRNLVLVWDVESTSNKPTQDHIISLGAVLCRFTSRLEPLATFHSYVSTDRSIDPVAQAIHHITPAMLAGQPTFPEVLDRLEAWLCEQVAEAGRVEPGQPRVIWLAHNGTSFDNIMLFCNAVLHHRHLDSFFAATHCGGFADSLKLLRTLFKAAPDAPVDARTAKVSFALGNCYRSWCGGANLEHAHDALVDSQALVAILNSPPVLKRLNLTELFKFVDPVDKGLKLMRQRAGMAFARMEQEAQLTITEPQADDPRSAPPAGPDLTPLWSLGDPAAPAAHRMCLNCMRLVLVAEHLQCWDPTRSVQEALNKV